MPSPISLPLADNPYRNGNNRLYTEKLFIELSEEGVALYTLRDHTHRGLPSLFQLYMGCLDPTEYSFATQYLESWAHWETLQASPFFKPYLDRWRKELNLKIQSIALARIMEASKDQTSKSHFALNKFLTEGGWVPKKAPGRPSKDEISKAAKAEAEELFRLDSDFDRVLGSKDLH